MSYDELELDRMGDRRTATFFCISDTDSTYNFLVALAFSQMFNLLCERADNIHGGRLPHHVRVLWDEAANTGQVPNLEKLVAVIRSREVSLTLFYQQLAQCKAIYDKNAGQSHDLHADGWADTGPVGKLQPEQPTVGPGADDPQRACHHAR